MIIHQHKRTHLHIIINKYMIIQQYRMVHQYIIINRCKLYKHKYNKAITIVAVVSPLDCFPQYGPVFFISVN